MSLIYFYKHIKLVILNNVNLSLKLNYLMTSRVIQRRNVTHSEFHFIFSLFVNGGAFWIATNDQNEDIPCQTDCTLNESKGCPNSTTAMHVIRLS